MRKTYFLSSAAQHFNAKLTSKFEEPFEIVAIKSPTVYVLSGEGSDSRKVADAHVAELKRYVPPKTL